MNDSDDVVCHGTLPKIADQEGVLASFNIQSQKPKPKTKIIYDYKNADINGLIKHIKDFNFQNFVFNHPTVDQPEIYSKVLKNAFAQFVPTKTVTIRPADQPWANNYTCLLLRKKNRNYMFYKKCEIDYRNILNSENPQPEIVTRLLHRKNKSFEKSRQAANDSTTANRRVKNAFNNSVNATLNNPSLSAKKEIWNSLKVDEKQ